MDSGAIGTNEETSGQRPDRFDRTARLLMWLLGSLCAAMLAAVVWLSARAHALDAEMDVVAASLGGV